MNLFANEPKRELNLLGPQTPKDTKTTVLLLKLFTEAIFDSNNRPSWTARRLLLVKWWTGREKRR